MRPRAVIVFGEDENDQEAIRQLVMALRPDFPKIEKLKKPPIQMKGVNRARIQERAERVAKAVAAVSKKYDVRLIIAHQDCDEVEPSHEQLSTTIEQALHRLGLNVVAATPAFEIEAWWYLWPEAVHLVNPRWRRLNRIGREVGLIENVKERLTIDLRPMPRDLKVRDYTESDSREIAANVKARGMISNTLAQSHSFERFANLIRAARI